MTCLHFYKAESTYDGDCDGGSGGDPDPDIEVPPYNEIEPEPEWKPWSQSYQLIHINF